MIHSSPSHRPSRLTRYEFGDMRNRRKAMDRAWFARKSTYLFVYLTEEEEEGKKIAEAADVCGSQEKWIDTERRPIVDSSPRMSEWCLLFDSQMGWTQQQQQLLMQPEATMAKNFPLHLALFFWLLTEALRWSLYIDAPFPALRGRETCIIFVSIAPTSLSPPDDLGGHRWIDFTQKKSGRSVGGRTVHWSASVCA